jgi:hypothetical protein
MNSSPKDCSQIEINNIFDTNNCASRLRGGHIDLMDTQRYNPPLNGSVEWRFEQHTSKDQSCVVQYDIYVAEDRREVKIISNLEVNGEEYRVFYDTVRPMPNWEEL